MTFGERLKKLRQEKGLTLADLEEKFDRGRTAFSNYENDHRKPNMNLVNELADFFEVSVDFLMGREEKVQEEPERVELIPIRNITGGQALLATENIVGYRKVPQTLVEGGEYFYLRMNGDNSMINAGILNDSLIFIKKQLEIANGDIALVLLENQVCLRYLYSFTDRSVLQPANPNYNPSLVDQGEFKIIGKAIEVIRRL